MTTTNRPTNPEALTGEHTGIVDRLIASKGFGFIHADNGKDYFFHMSAVEGEGGFSELDLGDVVSFDGTVTIKGCRATGVQLVRNRHNQK
jgi:CspA family cold shock protein